MTDKGDDPIRLSRAVLGLFTPKNYVKLAVFAGCAAVLFLLWSGAWSIKERFFPTKKPATSSTSLSIEKDAKVEKIEVTNINNPAPDLKQGLYVGLSSDRAAVGVFKEVAPNVDLELGAGQTYEGEAFAEVRAKIKF